MNQTQILTPRLTRQPSASNQNPPTFIELRRRSFFGRALECHTCVPGGRAYGFTYRKHTLMVDKHGHPFASTDGTTYLRLGEARFKAERHRGMIPPKGLFADKGALLIDWGERAKHEAEHHFGARILVACDPGESYVVRRDTSWPASSYLTRVVIEAPQGHAHLDRMVACLAFFWAFYEARRKRLG